MASEDVDRAARLIERLLLDAAFRVEFRRDPATACRALELPGLAAELEGLSGKALHTLELRESRSSLAGVVLAAAAEGVGLAGFARYHQGLEGDARVAAGQALSRTRALQAVPEPAARASSPAASGGADDALGGGDTGRGVADGMAAGLESAQRMGEASTDAAAPSQAAGAAADDDGGGGRPANGAVADSGPRDISLDLSAPADAPAADRGGNAAADVAVAPTAPSAAPDAQTADVREAAAAPAAEPGAAVERATLDAPTADDDAALTSDDLRAVSEAPSGAVAGEQDLEPEVAPTVEPDDAAAPIPASADGLAATDGPTLADDPNLFPSEDAETALRDGTLDPRANVVLARLLASHELDVDVQPGPDGGPLTLVITQVDGEAVGPDAIAPRDIIGQLATLAPEERPTRIVTPWRIDAPGFATEPESTYRIVLDFAPQAEATVVPETPAAPAPAPDASAPAQSPDLVVPENEPKPADPEPDAGEDRGNGGGGPGAEDAADAAPVPAGPQGVPIGAAAVEVAKRYMGTPYYWGGETPDTGFDCSGLMQYAYKQLGVDIPRVTYDQVNAGVEVPRDQLQPGDLILFADSGGDVHHVGMYVGDNKFMHAPRTGDVVKISSLDEPHYAQEYHVARRVATGIAPEGVLTPAELEDAAKMAAGSPPSALPSAGALPAPGGVAPAAPAAPVAPAAAPGAPPAPPPPADPSMGRQSGVFAAVATPDQPLSQATFTSMRPVDPNAAAPADAGGGGALPVDPGTPVPIGENPYPGNDASKEALAGWLSREAQKAGLPPELPVMAALVESGVANLNFGDRDSVGFFQMRTGIWNQGDYAGYPEKPELQMKWFIDQALAVKAKRIAEGNTAFETDPSQWGEWIADIERPAEEYRYKYQTKLEEARGLLASPGAQPPASAAAVPAAADPAAAAPAPAGAPAAGAAGMVLPVAPQDMAGSNAGGALHGSEFGVVDAEGAPRDDGTRIHAGYDLFAKGGAPVRSMVAGTVVEVRASRGETGQIFGGTVKVQGADGKVYVFRHVDPSGVAEGQAVQAGQQVASVTNWRDGTPHVHMEVWKSFGAGYDAENMLDPLDELKAAAAGAPPPAAAAPPAPDPAAPAAAEQVAAAAPTPGVPAGAPTVGAAAVQIAERYMGTAYYWGGETPDTGFDCSGLMQYAYKQLGIDIPRVTYDQVNAGVEVPRDQLQPGDLILFADSGGDVHHVGMYVGDNKFLHAPRTGDVVKVSSLDEPHYAQEYHVARRMGSGAAPAGVLTPEELQEALAMGGGAPGAPGAPGIVPASADPGVAPAPPVEEAERYGRASGVFAAVQPAEAKSSGATVQFLPAVPAPAAAAAPAAAPDPAAATPAAPVPPVDAVQPLPPVAGDPANPYPGDAAGKEALAAWLAREAQKAGLPPELPVMASLVESGVANLNFGDRDSVGFFQMRTGIWNQGDYAGYPEKPELQMKWFIDQALAVKAKRIADGNTAFQTDPSQWGEWIADIERPAEEYRYKYQTKLEEAQALLAAAGAAPAAAPAAS